MSEKRYFIFVNGAQEIQWTTSPLCAFEWKTLGEAQGEADALNRGSHYITEKESGKKSVFKDFKVEQVDEKFIVSFDVHPSF